MLSWYLLAMSKQSTVAYDYTDKEVSAAYFNLPRLYSGVSITLENPILPAEILNNPPSLADGMDYETERAIRFCGCDLIQRASILLRLPQVAAATGQIIFHRFFYARSFLRCTFDYVCMACIYLASKIEESPRRIRDVINVFHQLKQRPARSVRRGCEACPIVRTICMYISNAVCPHDVIGCTFNLCDHTYTRLVQTRAGGSYAPTHIDVEFWKFMIEVSRWHFDSDDNYAWLPQQKILPCALDHRYVYLKNEVIKAERRILKELGFCVHVKHPHKLIYVFLKALNTLDNLSVLQKAWNFMNDSLRSDVFLRYAPETIACACVYMAARAYSIPMPLDKPWWRLFNASDREIYDICFRILGLYRQKYMDWAEAEEILNRLRQLREKKLAVANAVDATVVDEFKQKVDQEGGIAVFESKKTIKATTARRRRNTEEDEKYSSYSRRNGHGEKGGKCKSRRMHRRSRSRHSRSRSRSRSRHHRRHRSRHRRHRHWDAGFREKLSPRFFTVVTNEIATAEQMQQNKKGEKSKQYKVQYKTTTWKVALCRFRSYAHEASPWNCSTVRLPLLYSSVYSNEPNLAFQHKRCLRSMDALCSVSNLHCGFHTLTYQQLAKG
ncbi:Cyclin-L2 [Trichinella zimbabwensis]|uniref:Cyclin-L2 n=1 Tax=Trichinella zimbabwensis TaxID=268475 RepID=A0A0V1GUY6_9BILA|nr:Cyclin-L2 [Trichinella zimbabwensis]